ncbi:hypothetical protein [Variovorax sp. E3]|uniref:hypothetical protein n=1 Tax=Variovorax sp. E3 TaxID=1914993 RepID=UPI0035AF6EF6
MVHDLGRGLLDREPDAHRDALGVVLRVAVDPRGGFAQQRGGAGQGDFDGAQVRLPVGIGLRARGFTHAIRDAQRATEPARGNARPALPETGAPHVVAGLADPHGARVVEAHIDARARGHADGVPAFAGHAHAGLVHRHGREARLAFGVPAADDRVRDAGRAGTPGLGAVQADVACAIEHHARVGRLGAPCAPACARGNDGRAAEFGQDRQRVGVAFEELDQREIVGGHGCEHAPALQGLPRARSRQTSRPASTRCLSARSCPCRSVKDTRASAGAASNMPSS